MKDMRLLSKVVFGIRSSCGWMDGLVPSHWPRIGTSACGFVSNETGMEHFAELKTGSCPQGRANEQC